MILVKNLTKKYQNTTAVNNISFEVKEGENLVLLGTSGCGKTTTLKMLNRLIDADSGEILINNKNIQLQQPELLRRNIGYVLQNNGLFPHYTVAENIAVVPKLLKWPHQKTIERINYLLEKVHLPAEHFANMYPSQLSGGQQQRVGLARALAANPGILLMDEPFGALDPLTRAAVRKDFRELDDLKRKTIVLVTHDVQDAFELGDRICLMNKGEIVQIGSPVDLLFKPANDFVKMFFNEQRLQLEYKSVTLDNLWPYLQQASAAGRDEYFDSQADIWQAFDYLTSSKNSTQHFITINRSGETKQATYIDLLTAFDKYKSSR